MEFKYWSRVQRKAQDALAYILLTVGNLEEGCARNAKVTAIELIYSLNFVEHNRSVNFSKKNVVSNLGLCQLSLYLLSGFSRKDF